MSDPRPDLWQVNGRTRSLGRALFLLILALGVGYVAYSLAVDAATRFIPTWVKVAVVLAVGSAPWSAGGAS